jgi:hypothetical protein
MNKMRGVLFAEQNSRSPSGGKERSNMRRFLSLPLIMVAAMASAGRASASRGFSIIDLAGDGVGGVSHSAQAVGFLRVHCDACGRDRIVASA